MVSSLGSVYIKRQRQPCDNSAITLAILFSLKTMESLQIGVAIHFQATLFFSMRSEMLASSQSCHSIDADTWYKWHLKVCSHEVSTKATATSSSSYRMFQANLYSVSATMSKLTSTLKPMSQQKMLMQVLGGQMYFLWQKAQKLTIA